jgi:hypothetical protein
VGLQAVTIAVLAFLAFDRAPDSILEPEGNNMSKLLIALFVAAGLGVAGCATQGNAPVVAAKPMAPAAPISKDAYDTAVKNAEAQYKVDKDACSPRTGNAKDVCVAEANGKEKVAKADAEAAYKNTPKAREDMRDTRAEATYNVAKQKCDALAGNAKDVCVKEASAQLTKTKADAKVDRVAADTRQESTMKQAEARHEATDAKRDADYKLAIEKCNSLSGPVKDACISDAKTYYGK